MSKKNILVLVLTLAAGALAGYWYATQLTPKATSTTATDTAQEKKPLYYRSPMNPAITSPTAAKDSMGMDYIPVYAEETAKTK